MIRPDGMGADRYRERQNMMEAAHKRPDNFAIVTRAMDIINDGFTTRQSAEDWMERRLSGEPKPSWSDEEVEVQNIG